MIYTHYPENPLWQLLDPPMSASALAQKPNFRGSWFLSGLGIPEGIGKLNTANGISLLRVDTPETVTLTSSLYTRSGSQISGGSLSQHAEGVTEIYIAPPAAGEYLLRIFAAQGGGGKAVMALEIGIVADETTGMRLPIIYKSFHDDGCYLSSPIDKPPIIGEEYYFEIELPDFEEAYLSDGKNRFPMIRSDDYAVFAVSITVPSCENLTLYARKASSGRSYTGIASFPVD